MGVEVLIYYVQYMHDAKTQNLFITKIFFFNHSHIHTHTHTHTIQKLIILGQIFFANQLNACHDPKI